MASACTIERFANELFPKRCEYVSAKQAARETSLSEKTIRRRIASGELQSTKIGSRRLISRDSLESLLSDR